MVTFLTAGAIEGCDAGSGLVEGFALGVGVVATEDAS